MKHANVAIFVPHNGCPHQCSFCDQREITGTQKQPTAEDVTKAIDIARASLGQETKKAEVAFFGGSFTAINRTYMENLLKAAFPAVANGEFAGIRISTRPDAVDDTVLKTLKSYGVTSIELGAQSMDNTVLSANHRGHTAEDVVFASERIKDKGFSLGLQMMTGLYGSTAECDRKTAADLAALEPDTMRIYPTVVLKNTELYRLYIAGKYHPQTLEEAVALCTELLQMFESKNISVIRLGLHDSDSLRENMVAGAFHPAFRELCESEILYLNACEALKCIGVVKGTVEFHIHPSSVSKFIGQKRRNLERFSEQGIQAIVRQDSRLSKYEVRVFTCVSQVSSRALPHTPSGTLPLNPASL